MRTGLAASTDTPGITAPLVSRATPLIALWANAAPDKTRKNPMTRQDRRTNQRLMPSPLFFPWIRGPQVLGPAGARTVTRLSFVIETKRCVWRDPTPADPNERM